MHSRGGVVLGKESLIHGGKKKPRPQQGHHHKQQQCTTLSKRAKTGARRRVPLDAPPGGTIDARASIPVHAAILEHVGAVEATAAATRGVPRHASTVDVLLDTMAFPPVVPWCELVWLCDFSPKKRAPTDTPPMCAGGAEGRAKQPHKGVSRRAAPLFLLSCTLLGLGRSGSGSGSDSGSDSDSSRHCPWHAALPTWSFHDAKRDARRIT